jgi:hypothetical protein
MSNARKKAKKEKKAKERREKAKQARARVVEDKAADRERDKQAPPHERRSFRGDGKPASSKPAGKSPAQVHRTQGK